MNYYIGTVDSNFPKILAFHYEHYEANSRNFIYKEFEEFSIDLLNNIQLCIDKEQKRRKEFSSLSFRY